MVSDYNEQRQVYAYQYGELLRAKNGYPVIDELDELDELDDGRLVVVNVSGITDSYLDYVQPGYGEDNTGYALWDVQGNILLGTRKGRIPPES